MNNFEKYFIRPKSKGFKKNLEMWKAECSDFKKYNDIDEAKNIYLFYHTNKGICEHPECNANTKFISLGRGFKETCSRIHSMELTSLRKYGVKYKSQLPEFRDAVKKTNLEKYGSESVFSSEVVKDKIKKTNLEKYGCKNPMQNTEIKDKNYKTNIDNNGGIGFQLEIAKETMIEKYGVSNPSQVKEFQDKKRETFIENYGVSNPMKSKKIQDKVKMTNLEKYGCENVFSSEVIKDKIKATNLEKYGYENAASNPEIREKCTLNRRKALLEKYNNENMFKTKHFKKQRIIFWKQKYGVEHPMQISEVFEKNLNSCYRRKEYTWETGEISLVQGNEPIVLKELEDSGYRFDDVKTAQIDMPEIWYMFEGNKSRYYPDFYIPSENLIIEVKSKFTLEIALDRNNAKFDKVREMGFEFKLEVR